MQKQRGVSGSVWGTVFLRYVLGRLLSELSPVGPHGIGMTVLRNRSPPGNELTGPRKQSPVGTEDDAAGCWQTGRVRLLEANAVGCISGIDLETRRGSEERGLALFASC